MLIIQRLSITFSLIFMAIVLYLVYKRKLREEYSLLWLFGGITLVVLSFFPRLLVNVAGLVGISYPPSLLFVVAIFFVIIIVLSQAISITTLIQRDRDLTQKVALLEWHLEKCKQQEKENN